MFPCQNPEQPLSPIEPPDDDDGYDKAIDDTLLPPLPAPRAACVAGGPELLIST